MNRNGKSSLQTRAADDDEFAQRARLCVCVRIYLFSVELYSRSRQRV